MDDFDRRLTTDLKHLLDHIVDAPVPKRRRRAMFRALPGGLIEQSGEFVVVASVQEPVPASVAPVGSPF